MTIHIMLDLETWGTEPGCDIRSIGACVFDPLTGWVAGDNDEMDDGGIDQARTFYIACDNPSEPEMTPGYMLWNADEQRAYKYALRRDPKTVKWWSDQSDEAQAAFANPVDLRDALGAFGRWLYHDVVGTDHFEEYGLTGIKLWSHGPAFDPPILAAAYRAVGLSVPWNYRTPRDTRTAFDMAGIHDDDDGSYRTFMTAYNTGTYHHALDDAIAQAKSVCGAFQLLRVPHDVITHRDVWRGLIEHERRMTNDDNETGYWSHELRTFDRTFDALAALPHQGGEPIPRAVTISDPSTLTTAENAIRDATLEQAASVCEEITSWGLSPTKLEVAQSTQRFCAKAIRAQKSDSPERKAHEAKNHDTDH